jgi:hypothetical protein
MSSFVSECKTFKKSDVAPILENIRGNVGKLKELFGGEFGRNWHDPAMTSCLLALGAKLKSIEEDVQYLEDGLFGELGE